MLAGDIGNIPFDVFKAKEQVRRAVELKKLTDKALTKEQRYAEWIRNEAFNYVTVVQTILASVRLSTADSEEQLAMLAPMQVLLGHSAALDYFTAQLGQVEVVDEKGGLVLLHFWLPKEAFDLADNIEEDVAEICSVGAGATAHERDNDEKLLAFMKSAMVLCAEIDLRFQAQKNGCFAKLAQWISMILPGENDVLVLSAIIAVLSIISIDHAEGSSSLPHSFESSTFARLPQAEYWFFVAASLHLIVCVAVFQEFLVSASHIYTHAPGPHGIDRMHLTLRVWYVGTRLRSNRRSVYPCSSSGRNATPD